ncbi:MAG: helix-hairpin-helix domain-containing protein, partial [Candidatus Zixiibacteriota bacterium]
YALGIIGVGETAAVALAERFMSIEALMDAALEELLEVEGVGPGIADSVAGFFDEKPNRKDIRRLLEAGVTFAFQKRRATSQALSGKTFVITGTLSNPRERYKSLIETHGGRVASAVSKNTDFLLAGEKAGSKLATAEKLSVKVIDEDQFGKMIG